MICNSDLERYHNPRASYWKMNLLFPRMQNTTYEPIYSPVCDVVWRAFITWSEEYDSGRDVVAFIFWSLRVSPSSCLDLYILRPPDTEDGVLQKAVDSYNDTANEGYLEYQVIKYGVVENKKQNMIC